MKDIDVSSNIPFPGRVSLQPRVACSNPVILKVWVPGPTSAFPENFL